MSLQRDFVEANTDASVADPSALVLHGDSKAARGANDDGVVVIQDRGPGGESLARHNRSTRESSHPCSRPRIPNMDICASGLGRAGIEVGWSKRTCYGDCANGYVQIALVLEIDTVRSDGDLVDNDGLRAARVADVNHVAKGCRHRERIDCSCPQGGIDRIGVPNQRSNRSCRTSARINRKPVIRINLRAISPANAVSDDSHSFSSSSVTPSSSPPLSS